MDIDYLRTCVATHPRRPIIHHLNADTSWLVQFPIPPHPSSSAGETSESGRAYYNVLLDPWLAGSQADVASWFSQQWHAIPSAYSSIAEVQNLCATVEDLASSSPKGQGGSNGRKKDDLIDVVAISHEFTDHCHKQTLLELPRSTPVFAWSKAAKLIRGWKWFERVVEVPAFRKDWRETVVDPLPPWLGIGRLFNEDDGLYYHAALTLTFLPAYSASAKSASPNKDGTESTSGAGAGAEVIIYTPHGLHAPTLTPIPLASPPVAPLCLLHGLHDVSLDWRQQLNLGAHSGLAAQRMLGAKYWMGTHDEEKTGKGVVSWFLRRRVYTVEQAVEREKEVEWEQVGEGNAVPVVGAKDRKGRGEDAGAGWFWSKGKKGAGVIDKDRWNEKVRNWEGTGWREIGNGEAVLLREDGT